MGGCCAKKKKKEEDEGGGKCALSPETMKLVTLLVLLISDFDVVLSGARPASKRTQ